MGGTIWREAEGPTITLRDAQAAEELVNDELDRRFFRDRHDKATEAERIYLAAMADLGDSGHTSGEIASHMGVTQKGLSVRRAGANRRSSANAIDSAILQRAHQMLGVAAIETD